MARLSLLKGWIPGVGHGPRLAVASLRRRFLASLIDALVAILALVLLIGTGVLALARARKQKPDRGLFRRLGALGPDISRTFESRTARLVLDLIALAASTLVKQRRSPGFRVLGLRLVNARTGGEPSRQQKVIRASARQVWRTFCRRLIRMPKPRSAPEHERLRSEIEAARDRFAGDSDALQHEMIRIYQENRVQPVRISCLPALARSLLIAAIDLPAFWSPLKQSLPDRLAAVVTVRDSGR